mmetsp:Transcript_16563/g.25758  ORF Transcript_16563/g.25758 Transcript_16563/m.25758 type:complete len:341 (-) Transcript_16563:30-1052(-)
MMTTRTTRRSQHDNDVKSDDEIPAFKFNGKTYATYQEMVNAKRKRNQDMLEAAGLLKPPQPPLYTTSVTSNKRNKNKQTQLKAAPQQPSRRSSRLSQSEKPNYKEVSTFIELQAAIVKKRPRTTTTESRIVSPSPVATPAPPAANSVRSINIDTKTLVLGEKGLLGQMMEYTGKEYVINESFALAAYPDDQKRLAGSRLSFNKYCGVQEFKNAIFLWINLGSKDNPVVNDFLDNAQQVSWFGGSRMHDESPVIHKLLKMGKQNDDTGGSDKSHSDIILWCRRYQTDTKKFTPYVCFGRLTYHSHIPQSHPLKFIWNLVDHDGMKNHSDMAVRERFAAFTT